MVMSPCSKSISRLITFNAVVLPAPDGPTSMQISPAPMLSDRLSTAGCCWPAYRFVTESKTISAAPPLAPERADGPSSWAVSGLVTEASSREPIQMLTVLGFAERPDAAHEHARAEARGALDIGWVAVDHVRRHLESDGDRGSGQVLEVELGQIARLRPVTQVLEELD